MKGKALCMIILLLGILINSVAEANVLPRILYNHFGEIMVDYLDFVDEFGRVFKGANIGGEKRHYSLFFIGDNTKNSVEICYRLSGGEIAPFDNPASVISTIYEIKLPFKDREEMRKAVKSADRIVLITLLVYDQYQDLPAMFFLSTLPKKGKK